MNTSSNTVAAATRAPWVKPAIQRMASGSAEAGGRSNSDGGIGQS